jgi:hypothetical protein
MILLSPDAVIDIELADFSRSEQLRRCARRFGVDPDGDKAMAARSPHERSNMREQPGYRFAHPGYACSP